MGKKHSFLVIFSCLVLVVATLFVPITSNAANYEFLSEHNEPTVSDYCGYVNLAVQGYYSTGVDLVTLAWYVEPELSSGDTISGDFPTNTVSVGVNINKSSVVLEFLNNSYSLFNVFIYELQPTGQFCLLKNTFFDSSSYVFTDAFPSSATIKGASFYGNVSGVSFYSGNYLPSVSVTWNKEAENQELLLDILAEATSLNENSETIISKLIEIYNQNVTTNKHLVQMKSLLESYLGQNELDNARIIELLDMIESYLVGDEGYAHMSDFDYDVQQGQTSLNESKSDYGSSVPMDENGVPLDDIRENSNIVTSLLDSVMSRSLEVYTAILNVFTENDRIAQMIMIALTFSLGGFVFFGRR